MTKFFINATGAGYEVLETTAKTLRGAKAAASRYFQESVGSTIRVMVKYGSDFETVAAKPAFERWVNV